MKVRDKSTGDIIEVTPIMKYSERLGQYFESVEDEAGRELNLNDVEVIESKDTSIPDCGEGVTYIDPSISYWQKLEHQYAGMAMQGLLANHYITDRIDILVLITEAASTFAKSLVEKARYEENPKELEGLKKELEALKIEKTILENKIKLLTEESK